VLNLRTLKPIDRDGLAASISKTHRVLSVEEGWPQHGVGAGAPPRPACRSLNTIPECLATHWHYGTCTLTGFATRALVHKASYKSLVSFCRFLTLQKVLPCSK